MRDLSIKKIPVPKGDSHIEPPNGMGLMPVHEFTMGLIAPKGSGKTTTIVNLLEIYSKYFHKIYIFSPTIKSDSKWDYAKKLPVLIENLALKKWIKDNSKSAAVNGPIQPLPLDKLFQNLVDTEKKFQTEIPEEWFFHDYNDEKFRELMENQKKTVDLLKDHGQLKTLADRVLVIFDDQVGSPLFSGKKRAYFTGINTKHRHHSASFIMVSQGYKEIPKTIRTNWTCLLLFKIGNMKELFVIYEEFQMGLTWEEWLELYREATEEDFQFLFIDMYGPKNFRMRKNFDKALMFTQLNNDT